MATLTEANLHNDILYQVTDQGTRNGSVNKCIIGVVDAYGLLVNKQLCDAAKQTFTDGDEDTLLWLLKQTGIRHYSDLISMQLFNRGMDNDLMANAFTVFQAFFMGYYYGIVLKLVDATSLEIRSVDGAWGFRSTRFFDEMRSVIIELRKERKATKHSQEGGAGLTRTNCTAAEQSDQYRVAGKRNGVSGDRK